ncbi:MAG TPA: hypothetical protein VK497_01515 [Candidatus Saccharimonadales bacterium]|nr:hypothetical protein [Candidatus Saccharimonadales bacterium]
MDIQPKAQQPISDDQELAKVLAGVNQQAEEAAATETVEETPAPVVAEEPAVEPVDAAPVMPDPIAAVASVAPDGDLDAIKQEALGELRPLVDKLDVSPEEKFDTYLLLLRSTDDKALIGPAHEAARGIADEARRAQALLDIIKEIDYLSGAGQQQAA